MQTTEFTFNGIVRESAQGTRRLRALRLLAAGARAASVVALTATFAGLWFAAPASAQVTGRDYDYDGLTDDTEVTIGTLWGVADTDADGLTDGEEFNIYHTNPLNPDGDGDSFWDGQEVKVTHTNPLLADSDGDGFTELDEYYAGTNPLDPSSSPAAAPAPAPAPDAGGAGQGGERADTDGDGYFDDDETNVYGTDPNVYDTDGDGVGDGEEGYNGTNPLDANDF